MKLEILYEDELIMIINKPAGLMMHTDNRESDDLSKMITLADILKKEYPNFVGIGEYEDRPGIVHRLDQETSGIIVLCKTQGVFEDMKTSFKNHKVRKSYYAIVEGNIRDDTGIIDKPIARARSDFRKKNVVDIKNPDYRGEEREALTKYKVLERANNKKYTLIACFPETGRTHQIRVHMKSIRHPIVGDKLYGTANGFMLSARHMLHANKIEFTLRGKKIKVESIMPEDMKTIWQELNGKS